MIQTERIRMRCGCNLLKTTSLLLLPLEPGTGPGHGSLKTWQIGLDVYLLNGRLGCVAAYSNLLIMYLKVSDCLKAFVIGAGMSAHLFYDTDRLLELPPGSYDAFALSRGISALIRSSAAVNDLCDYCKVLSGSATQSWMPMYAERGVEK